MRAGEHSFFTQLEPIAFEFQLRCPQARAIADECDRGRYVAKVLAVINPVLRKMYGLEISRTAKAVGGTFRLNRTPVGRLFVLVGPEEAPGIPDRPFILSRLLPDLDNVARIQKFLEERFYDEIAPAAARRGETRRDAGELEISGV